MIPKSIFKLSFFVFSILILSCKKEDKSLQLETLGVDVNELGAIFNGEISNSENVLEYGFLYSRRTEFDPLEALKLNIETPPKDGLYSIELNTGLRQDEKYNFAAFAFTKNDTLYGEVKSFFSTGSATPILDSLSATEGHVGDVITAYGKYFGDNINSGFIFVGFKDPISNSGGGTSIISLSDSVLTFLIGSQVLAKNYEVYISSFEKESERIDFTFYTPRIDSISPQFPTFNDTITIHGDHFQENGKNTVYFNERFVDIESYSRKKLKAVIPNWLRNSRVSIDIEAQGQKVTKTEAFRLAPPKILNAPSSAKSREVIKIYGDNFYPFGSENIVTIGGVPAQSTGKDDESISYYVPEGPYPNKNVKIEVNILDYSVESPLEITDQWRLIADELPFFTQRASPAFVLDNTAYIIGTNSRTDGSKYVLWQYDPGSIEWIKKELPDGLVNQYNKVVVYNNKAYLYNSEYNPNFWEYTASTNTWKELARFDHTIIEHPVMFAIDNKVYIGNGSNNAYFKKYDISSNEWEYVLDRWPSDRRRSFLATFVIDEIAYVGAGATNTGQKQFWKFDSESEKWSSIPDLHTNSSYSTGIEFNGVGFLLGGLNLYPNSWFYNPVSNTWNSSEESFGNDFYLYRSFAFVINETLHVADIENGKLYQFQGFRED